MHWRQTLQTLFYCKGKLWYKGCSGNFDVKGDSNVRAGRGSAAEYVKGSHCKTIIKGRTTGVKGPGLRLGGGLGAFIGFFHRGPEGSNYASDQNYDIQAVPPDLKLPTCPSDLQLQTWLTLTVTPSLHSLNYNSQPVLPELQFQAGLEVQLSAYSTGTITSSLPCSQLFLFELKLPACLTKIKTTSLHHQNLYTIYEKNNQRH